MTRYGQLTNVSGNITIQSRKHQIAVLELLWCAVLDHKLADALSERQGLLPFNRILVFLAR